MLFGSCDLKEVYVYCDVFEYVVGYLLVKRKDQGEFGFIFGKVKVVFLYGYIIFCFEFCVVVLLIEIV